MTALFVGGFGRNAQKAVQVPSGWETIFIDAESAFVPEHTCVVIAGLGSQLTESVIRAIKGNGSRFMLVKPFTFEHKDAQAERSLSLIPAGCETYIFDNQKLADENSKQGIADFQKSLFAKIESQLHCFAVF